MNDEPAGLRGTRLLLARIGALTLSLGILVVLMVRAGGGCRAEEAAVVPEPRSAEPAATAPVSSVAPAATAPASSAAPAVSAPPHFFPGSKSMGGSIVDPPAHAQPAPSGSSRYNVIFPGTKADPHFVDPARGGR